jgi:hypothetical protein
LITLQSNCQRVLDNLYRHLQEDCLINKERGNLFAIPLKKLKVKINIKEATDSFKNCKRKNKGQEDRGTWLGTLNIQEKMGGYSPDIRLEDRKIFGWRWEKMDKVLRIFNRKAAGLQNIGKDHQLSTIECRL